MFKIAFLTFLCTVTVLADITFHPCEYTVFDRKRNIVLYSGNDYKAQPRKDDNFILYNKTLKQGIKLAPGPLQLGYMYGEFFAAKGLGYVDTTKHPVYEQVMTLRKKKKFEKILGVVQQYIKKDWRPNQEELQQRWFAYRAKKVHRATRRLENEQVNATPINNGRALSFEDKDNNCFALFKISKNLKKNEPPKRKSDLTQCIQSFAARLELNDQIVEAKRITSFEMSTTIDLAGDLEPFYALNPSREFKNQKALQKAVKLRIGNSTSGNVVPHLFTREHGLHNSDHIDENSLARAFLLAYVLGIPDLVDDDFITEWDPTIKKFKTRLVDYQRAFTKSNKDLARSRKKGQGLHKFADYFLSYGFLDDDMMGQIQGWKALPSVLDFIYLGEEGKLIAEDIIKRITVVQSALDREGNLLCSYQDLFKAIITVEKEVFIPKAPPRFVFGSDFEEDKKTPVSSKANWTHTFQTKIGEAVHTPNSVQLGFMCLRGGIRNGKGACFNGFTFKNDCDLKTDMSLEEFRQELKKGGLYISG